MSSVDKLTPWLASYLSRSRPFSWSEWNCTHFAADWVACATGRQLPADAWCFPGPKAARRYARSAGGMVAAVTAVLGCADVPASIARVGDLIWLPPGVASMEVDRSDGALGVCCGRTTALLGPNGACFFTEAAETSRAWRLSDIAGAIA